jgi:hypothetical protein
VSSVIATAGVKSYCGGVAVSRDGSTLLLSDRCGIHSFHVTDGSRFRVVGGADAAPRLPLLCRRESAPRSCCEDAVIMVSQVGWVPTASVCLVAATALFFVASRVRATVTVSCGPRRHHHVAVTDYCNRVSVFSVEGAFVRHVGVALLSWRRRMLWENERVWGLSASGELVKSRGDDGFTGVAMHGSLSDPLALACGEQNVVTST